MFARRIIPFEGPQIRDPLAVVPRVPPDVVLRDDGKGHVHLRKDPEPRGLRKVLSRWMKFDFSTELAMDETGTLFFRLVDGRRTVRDIAAAMASRLGRKRRDIEPSVMLFLRKLMERQFILLEVTPDSVKGATS